GKDGQNTFAGMWDDLASQDGTTRVHHAIWGLVAGKAAAVAHLKTVLVPVPKKDLTELDRLFKELDSEVFEVREKASKDIETLGEAAEPALRKLFQSTTSPEARQRARQLLARLAVSLPSSKS